jgi:hypothetical protein
MPRFRLQHFGLQAALTLFVLPALAHSASAEKARKPRPPLPAQQYAMHDTHPREHVTIAAEPGDTKETRPDTRLDYYGHGMMPVRVIVTNDSDFALTLDDARIHLIAADNSVIPAATDDDLERRMFTFKSATGTKVPLPLPLPPITIHHGSIDKKIVADDRDFGFQTTTVLPHTTVAGYLFYDMQGIDPPFLSHATLELRKVRVAATNQALDSFEIPLQPTSKDAAAARAGVAQQ